VTRVRQYALSRAASESRAICAQFFDWLLFKIEEALVAARPGDPEEVNFLRCKVLIDAEAEQAYTKLKIDVVTECYLFRFPAVHRDVSGAVTTDFLALDFICLDWVEEPSTHVPLTVMLNASLGTPRSL
jgi:hypothetical protein